MGVLVSQSKVLKMRPGPLRNREIFLLASEETTSVGERAEVSGLWELRARARREELLPQAQRSVNNHVSLTEEKIATQEGRAGQSPPTAAQEALGNERIQLGHG